jgi:hypothetical protein
MAYHLAASSTGFEGRVLSHRAHIRSGDAQPSTTHKNSITRNSVPVSRTDWGNSHTSNSSVLVHLETFSQRMHKTSSGSNSVGEFIRFVSMSSGMGSGNRVLAPSHSELRHGTQLHSKVGITKTIDRSIIAVWPRNQRPNTTDGLRGSGRSYRDRRNRRLPVVVFWVPRFHLLNRCR